MEGRAREPESELRVEARLSMAPLLCVAYSQFQQRVIIAIGEIVAALVEVCPHWEEGEITNSLAPTW